MMAIAWLFLLPCGAIASRYYKPVPAHAKGAAAGGLPGSGVVVLSKPIWLQLHRGAALVGVVLVLVSSVLAIGETPDGQHGVGDHKTLGLVLTCMVVVQPLNALVRPKNPPAGTPKSALRLGWEWFHKLYGWALLGIAFATCLPGAELADMFYGTGNGYYNTMLTLILIWIPVILILEVRKRLVNPSPTFTACFKDVTSIPDEASEMTTSVDITNIPRPAPPAPEPH